MNNRLENLSVNGKKLLDNIKYGLKNKINYCSIYKDIYLVEKSNKQKNRKALY
jgi:hypothetical protein